MRDSRRLKLLVTTGTLPAHDDDGEPRFVADLSAALRRHMDVTILAPAHADVPLRHELSGVPVVRYRYAPLRTLERIAYPGGFAARLRRHPLMWFLVPGVFAGLRAATSRLLREGRFDCVHCHWAIPQGFLQGAFFRGPSYPPYMLTLHGGDVYAGRDSLRRRMIVTALGGAAGVTAVSEALRRHVAETFPSPTTRTIDVIPMGCDLGAFAPGYGSGGLAHELGLRRPLILFVGRLAEKKGVAVLLKAMASDAMRDRAANLLIVGDVPLRGELEAMSRSLRLEPRVRFAGAVTHHALPRLYASADLFCAPSVIARNGDCEGLPTVLSEAGASGLAAVASAVGGIPEIIEDGVTGLLVPPGDDRALSAALVRVIDDDALRHRLAGAARLIAARFDWGVIAERYAAVLTRAVESRGSRHQTSGGDAISPLATS